MVKWCGGENHLSLYFFVCTLVCRKSHNFALSRPDHGPRARVPCPQGTTKSYLYDRNKDKDGSAAATTNGVPSEAESTPPADTAESTGATTSTKPNADTTSS